MARIELRNLSKQWPDGTIANHEVSLDIEDGEFMVLLGSSGCGKSTLLRMIAGLEEPTSGVITVDGEDVAGKEPRERDVAMVFQSYALYPHMTVRKNLGFPLRMAKVPRADVEGRVREVAGTLGLEGHLDKKPGALSGGQMQRVALGRALVRSPRVFLFDEPLSNVDAKLRSEMRAELKELHRRLGTTMVYVTHDQVEAMTLGTRIAVMDHGRIQQVGRPLEVFRRPANRFVATFMGNPPMNVVARGAADVLRPESAPPDCHVGFRAESAVAGDVVRGEVALVESLGMTALVHLQVDGESVVVSVPADEAPAGADHVEFTVPSEALHLFDAKTGERIDV